MAGQVKVPETSRSYQKSIKGLSRGADRLWSQTSLKRLEHTPAAKHRGPRTKTAGAFLNNAKRWQGFGRTSGIKCVIARAELAGMSFFASLKGICSLSLHTILQPHKSSQPQSTTPQPEATFKLKANGWRFCVFAKGVCSLRLRRGSPPHNPLT